MKIYKSAKVLILRPDILSIALGVFWALFVAIITVFSIGSKQTNDLIELLKVIYPFYRISAWGLFPGIVFGFINGYILGFMIGYFYCWSVQKKIDDCKDLIFEIDFDKKVNEVFAAEPVIKKNPFTIAIVANPAILKQDRSDVLADPILEDKNLFFKVVTRIMRSFVNNELLKLPEILTRIRFVTVFNPQNEFSGSPEYKNALCEEIRSDPANIIHPRPKEMKEYVEQYLENAGMSKCVDIIFAISGSEEHTRSSATFTKENNSGNPENGDVRFKLKTNKKSYPGFHKSQIDDKDGQPGAIALSAWDDRLKTPVHEFAHAISSIENGVVVDEYVDKYEYQKNGATISAEFDFAVNKQHRDRPIDPIPQPFAKYELYDYNKATKKHVLKYQTEYFSDRYRSDKRPTSTDPDGWTSYVPERQNANLSCTMDIAYFGHQFDRLLFDFLYDRLLTKLNRPEK